MRLAEGWEQKDVAAKMGNPKLQPMISRYENPDYGRYSITTLLELAKVFDVALIVRFAKYSELVRWDIHKTSATLQPSNYANDAELQFMATETWMWRQESRTQEPTAPIFMPMRTIEFTEEIDTSTDVKADQFVTANTQQAAA